MSTPSQDISILIAVDSAGVRSGVQRALADAGYRVRTATEGDGAAGSAMEAPPDLVITVPDLPKVRGAELLEIARRAHPGSVGGLFLVAAGDTRPLPLGALQSALRLPVGSAALVEAVENLLALMAQASPPPLDLPPPSPEPSPPPPATDDEMHVEEVDPDSIVFDSEEGPVVANGRLTERPLAELLVAARGRGVTGHLVLETGGVEKRIHLLHGRPVYCESNLLVETLGEMLLAEKAVSQADLEKAQSRMIEEGLRQGDALVAVGAIDREALAAAIKRHVHEKLVSAFAWVDADWRIEEVETEAIRVLDTEVEPLWVAAEGVRRFTEPARLLAFFDTHRDRYPVPVAGLAREAAALSAMPGGSRLPGVLDGQVTLTEAQSTSGLDELLFTQLMMTLWRAGLVAFQDVPSDGPIQKPALDEDFITDEVDRSHPPEDAAPDPAPAVEVDPVLRDDILAAYTRLPHADPFELLGVDPAVDEAGVGSAFADWAARLGPDRAVEIGDVELARLARQVWLRIVEAYDALKDAEGRTRWRAERARREAGAPGRTRWLDADRAFATGLTHLEASRMVEALEAFRAAGDLNRKEPVYRLHAAWTAWQLAREAGDTDAMATEEETARGAVEAIPILDQGWIFLGEMARGRGDLSLARECFEKALLFNPSSTAARAALASLPSG